MQLFTDFRPDTRLWIYAFNRKLNPGELTLVHSMLRNFVDEWKSHQVDVRGAFEILYDQFVLIAGESSNGISGCSIDSSVSVLKMLKTQNGLDALDRSLIYYRDDFAVRTATRQEFQKLVDSGQVTPQTIVFNNAITAVGELMSGQWELPFAQSWHAVAFTSA